MTLAPTILYDFHKLPDETKADVAKSLRSGKMNKAMAASIKADSKKKQANPTADASAEKTREAAESLAKLIAGALPLATRQKANKHPGFASPAFGELLRKEIADSFGGATKEASP